MAFYRETPLFRDFGISHVNKNQVINLRNQITPKVKQNKSSDHHEFIKSVTSVTLFTHHPSSLTAKNQSGSSENKIGGWVNMAEKLMNAVWYNSYGGGSAGLKENHNNSVLTLCLIFEDDILRLYLLQHVEIPVPSPTADEILLKVEAASINPIDWKFQKGMMRPFMPKKFPFIPVGDVAGEIVEVGSGVKNFKVGDKIISTLSVMLCYVDQGVAGGGLAEYAVAKATSTVARPPEVSAADGASLVIAGGTAFHALTVTGGIKLDKTEPQSHILVTAASGGVGHYAVQLAKLGNTHVTATCGARNMEFVKSLGADEVLDYKTLEGSALKSPSGQKYDLVINCTTGIPWSTFKPNLSTNGLVIDLNPGLGSFWTYLVNKILRSKKKLQPLFVSPNVEEIGCLVNLVKEGKLKTDFDSRYPLTMAEKAWAKSMDGHATGKSSFIHLSSHCQKSKRLLRKPDRWMNMAGNLMKAVWYDSYGGGSDGLKHVEIPVPSPTVDEILLKVEAASINPIDWKIQKGMIRPFLPKKFPFIPVGDVAGEIVEVGPGVKNFKVGDKIISTLYSLFCHVNVNQGGTGGGFAEYAVAKATSTVPRPPEVSAADGASLVIAGCTALHALTVTAGINLVTTQPRTNILVTAASGGVGHYAVQLAKLGNTHVTATCGARNIEFVKNLGADEVLDYKTPEGSALKSPSGTKYDVVVNCTTGIPWATFEPNLGPNGLVIDITPGPGAFWTYAVNKITFSKKRLQPLIVIPNAEEIGCLVNLVKEGKVKTVIDSRYPLSMAEKAWAKSIEGHATGKICAVRHIFIVKKKGTGSILIIP
ncbi:hypothetical protein LXL04_000808 [Taraxacum kok-saghyz]